MSITRSTLSGQRQLWPQFRSALDQVEAAMIQEGRLDPEDLQA